MKKSITIIILFTASYQLFAQFEDLTFGSDSTLDVITWNIEHFPKNGQITINYVSQLIEALDVDVLAIQEVTDNTYLNQLVESLAGWDGVYAYNQYAALAYVYKTDIIKEVDVYEIYTSKSREFPRSPLVMEMVYEDEHYVIINNHLKCCGDGYLDQSNSWDEEKRRLDACNLLNQYIINNYDDEKVILLGDLNDILTDSPDNNVFRAFTDDISNYIFGDMYIAQGSSSNWSFPTWPSHLDHILLTSELFEEFENSYSYVQTIKVDEYFEEGWYEYDHNVSDHRPVGLKIKCSSNLGFVDEPDRDRNFCIYPNPVKTSTTISFNPAMANTVVEIYNIEAQKIQLYSILKNQTSITWNVENLPSGIYYAKLIVDGEIKAIRKIVVTK